MDDEKIIDFVCMYPVLYDTSHPKNMDANLKNDLWNNLGEELGMDGVICKTRWNNIRDTYRKSLKKSITRRMQGARKIKPYKYAKQLRFLNTTFEEAGYLSIDESDEDENLDEMHDIKREKDDPLLTPAADQAPRRLTRRRSVWSPPRSPPRKTTTPTVNLSATSNNQSTNKRLKKNEDQAPVPPQHPIDVFLAGISATLKTFSPYHLHLAKAEIFNTVQKYELKTIMADQSDSTRQSPLLQEPTTVTPIVNNDIVQE